MRLLFYTDPLKAAWMVREFGVKLLRENGSVFNDFLYEHRGSQTIEPQQEKFYIAPDSYLVFDPKDGDIGTTRGIGANFQVSEFSSSWYAGEGVDEDGGCGAYIRDDERCEIIYRDGKAFFEPEREE